MCKVSVIIPVYNVEKYLENCIESVLNQTLKDIEIICINDGSTDESGTILKKYEQMDSRIKVVFQENTGLSGTRNKGIKLSKGKYILFLDSDDFFAEVESLECLYEMAKNNELDELFYGTTVIFETAENQTYDESYRKYYNRNYTYTDVLKGKDMFVLFSKNNDFKANVCMQFFRRKFLIDNNLMFEEGLIHEDEIYTVKCMSLAERVAYLDKALFGRRMRANSIMTSTNYEKSILGYCKAIPILLQFASDNNLYIDEEFMEWYMKRLFVLCTVAARQYGELSEVEKRKVIAMFEEKEQAWIDIVLRTNENLENWKENVRKLKERFEQQKLVSDFLKVEKQQLEKEKQQLEKEKKRLEKEATQLEKEKMQLEEKKRLVEELEKTINSKSYKIGRSITYVPRKIRKRSVS